MTERSASSDGALSAARLEFLKGMSDFYDGQADTDGRIICPKHHIEHSGKNVYSVFFDAELYRLTGDDRYYERARRRALRIAGNLVKYPGHDFWIFYPGSMDRRTEANNVIEGGACADGLVCFLESFRERIPDDERARIEDAVFKHCDSYLTRAAPGKEITNQRLWGASGLASGYRYFGEASWKDALRASLENSFAEQTSDGAFYYHSKYLEAGVDVGIWDVTCYYHSRCLAFSMQALEAIGLTDEYLGRLKKGVDFLVGMYHPDGVKNLSLETKRWYWEYARYEVNSNAYDVYALVKGSQLTGDPVYLRFARKALDRVLEHQVPGGGIVSYHGRQRDQECRIMSNGHFAWVVKVIHDIPDGLEGLSSGPETVKYFLPETQLVKYENSHYGVLIRGNKRRMNLSWGCPVGGGSLIYFGTREDGWRNAFPKKLWTKNVANSFIFRFSFQGFGAVWESWREAWRRNRPDLVRGHSMFSFYTFKQVLRLLSELRSIETTHWAADCRMETGEDEVTFTLHPSRRNGRSIAAGINVVRRYRFLENEVQVEESVAFPPESPVKSIRYVPSPACRDVVIETSGRLRRRGNALIFKPAGGAALTVLVRYALG
jgi:hypothetical protein